MKKNLTCIRCPIGCSIEVEFEGKEVKRVVGNTCKRGEEYARQEIIAPKRVITSTVKVIGGDANVTSVKTNGSIPKEKIFECMEEINKQSVKSPAKIGDVVIKNLLESGVDVVITRNA